jgi:hypothetical protein
MHKVFLRCAFFVLPLAAAVWAGCSSDDLTAVDPAPEAGPEAAAVDAYVPPQDAALDASNKRDCKADLQADGIQKHLDCTGLYSDYAAKTVAPENKPYAPGVTFWSDGAEKSRFLYLPPGAKIDITDFDEWKFPNGTKVWKEFRLGTKRIETRLYSKANDSWRHTTYVWTDDGSDAVRKDDGLKLPITGKPDYEIPTRQQCNECHSGRNEPILGIEAVSLGLPTAQGVTLASLAAEGRFSKAPPVTVITIPNDNAGTAAPALAWLHANCGSCHNSNPNAPAAFTQLFLLLRPSQLVPEAGTAAVTDLDSYKSSVNATSMRDNTDAGAPYKRIVAKDPSASLVSILSGRRAPPGTDPDAQNQMPPLVSHQVDTAGHALLDAWINALP